MKAGRVKSPARTLSDKRPNDTPGLRIAFLSLGGLGDDLVKLNVLRQLAPQLREAYPGCSITWVGRQEYSFFRGTFDFVDNWVFQGALRHVNEVSPVIAEDYDITFDARYIVQTLLPGDVWKGPVLAGVNNTAHITQSLGKSLGKFAYVDDDQYLSWFLLRASRDPSRRLRSLTRDITRGYVVIGNGTDPMFGKPLVKQMAPSSIMHIATELKKHGISTIQVGTKDVQYIEAPGSADLTGKTTLEELIWIMANSLGFLACEGGIAHIGSHLKKPGVVLFGATSPDFWGYPNNLNLVAEKATCPYMPCSFKEDPRTGQVDPDWHMRCLAQEHGEIDLIQGFPQCMAIFDDEKIAGDVAEYFARHIEQDKLEIHPVDSAKPGLLRRMAYTVVSRVGPHRDEFQNTQFVTDRIAIGSYHSVRDRSELLNLGITGVLNVSGTKDFTAHLAADDRFEVHDVPLIDGEGNSIGRLGGAERLVRVLLQSNQKVLVHCHGGVSRSATVIALHLVKTGQAKTFDAAVKEVKKARPVADPHQALCTLAKEALNVRG